MKKNKAALECAYLCKTASRLQDKINGQYPEGLEIKEFDCVFFRINNSEFFIFDLDKDIQVFLFPDSSGNKDWIDNLRFWPSRDTKGEIHSGHWKQFEDIKDAVSFYFFKAQNEEKTIVWTGWSLGHSLCSLAIAHCETKYSFFEAFTFGGAKFCNKNYMRKFNECFKERFNRFCLSSDLVTKLHFLVYEHIGTEKKLQSGSFAKKVLKFWKWKSWKKESFNHHIDEYIKVLEKS